MSANAHQPESTNRKSHPTRGSAIQPGTGEYQVEAEYQRMLEELRSARDKAQRKLKAAGRLLDVQREPPPLLELMAGNTDHRDVPARQPSLRNMSDQANMVGSATDPERGSALHPVIGEREIAAETQRLLMELRATRKEMTRRWDQEVAETRSGRRPDDGTETRPMLPPPTTDEVSELCGKMLDDLRAMKEETARLIGDERRNIHELDQRRQRPVIADTLTDARPVDLAGMDGNLPEVRPNVFVSAEAGQPSVPVAVKPVETMVKRFKKPVAVPDRFDGSTPIDSYEKHFKSCSFINQWDGDDEAYFLAASLKGAAQAVLGGMAEADLKSYDAAMAALRDRFEPPGREELYEVQLAARIQKSGESMTDFSQVIRDLADRAFPNMPDSTRERMAMRYFSRQIADPDLRLRVQRSYSVAIHIAEKQRTGAKAQGSGPMRARAVRTEEDEAVSGDAAAGAARRNQRSQPNQSRPGADSAGTEANRKNVQRGQDTDETQKRLDACLRGIEALTEVVNTTVASLKEMQRRQQSGPLPSGPPPREGPRGPPARDDRNYRPPQQQRGGECFKCGRGGHFARDCQERGNGGGPRPWVGPRQ